MKRIKLLILISILSGFGVGIISAYHPVQVILLPVITTSIQQGKPDKNDTSITDTGSVEIIQDLRIPALVKKHIAINEKQKGIPGYRVQIFFGSKRKDALGVKADFLEKYPDIDAYTTYDEPYFKVRVGDFRTQLKAQKLHKEISGDFPNAFIVNDLISMPFLNDD